MVDDDKFVYVTRSGEAQGHSTERTMVARLPSLTSCSTVVRDLLDGSKVIARTRGGFVHYHTIPGEKTETTWPDSELDLVPYADKDNAVSSMNTRRRMYKKSLLDFVSGVSVVDAEDAATYLTPHGEKITGQAAGVWLSLPRVASVKTAVTVGDATRPQVAEVKAYFYTGHMRELVQFVLGIGVVKHRSWYARKHSLTQAQYLAWVDEQTGSVVDFNSVYANGYAVSVQYGYGYDRSHGVVFSADGNPYLVEISKANGVVITLLPRETGTEYAEFREKLVADADSEGVAVLDLFGGFPTGELPTSEWVAAGVSQRLLSPEDMPEYMQHVAIQPQLGWAFGYSDKEARVVGTRNDGTNQYMAYMRVSFAVRELSARPQVTENIANARIKLRASCVGNPLRRIKLEWITDAQAALLLNGADIDLLTITPPFAASAQFSVLETNPFYPATKVWSSGLGYCASLGYPFDNPPATSGDLLVSVYFSKNGGVVELREEVATGTSCGGPYTAQYATSQANNSSSDLIVSDETEITGLRGLNPIWDGYGRYDRWNKYWWIQRVRSREVRNGAFSEATAFIPYGDRESIVFAKKMKFASGYDQKIVESGIALDTYSYGVWPTHGTATPGPYGVVTEVVIINDSPYTYGPWSSEYAPCYKVEYDDPVADQAGIFTTASYADMAAFEAVCQFGIEVHKILSDFDTSPAIEYKYSTWFDLSNEYRGKQTMRTGANCFGPTKAVHCYDDINSGHYIIVGEKIADQLENFSPTYTGVV